MGPHHLLATGSLLGLLAVTLNVFVSVSIVKSKSRPSSKDILMLALCSCHGCIGLSYCSLADTEYTIIRRVYSEVDAMHVVVRVISIVLPFALGLDCAWKPLAVPKTSPLVVLCSIMASVFIGAVVLPPYLGNIMFSSESVSKCACIYLTLYTLMLVLAGIYYCLARTYTFPLDVALVVSLTAVSCLPYHSVTIPLGTTPHEYIGDYVYMPFTFVCINYLEVIVSCAIPIFIVMYRDTGKENNMQWWSMRSSYRDFRCDDCKDCTECTFSYSCGLTWIT